MSEEAVAVERPLLNPFNVVAGLIILMGLVLTFLRFTKGLGTVTNLDDTNPWGMWVGFDLFTGVALAAGGYVTAAAVEIFGMKKYHAALRPAILTGFLGYALVCFALSYDVGRPWRLIYPFFVSQGVTSVMFEVGACVMLYLTVLFLEFSPVALEWLGRSKLRNVAGQVDVTPDLPGRGSFDATPVFARCHDADRPLEAAPPVVLALHAHLLFRLEHRRRTVDGHLRGLPLAQILRVQDG